VLEEFTIFLRLNQNSELHRQNLIVNKRLHVYYLKESAVFRFVCARLL